MTAFDDQHIEQFITDSFSFHRDEEFHLLEISEQFQEQVSLAASGGKPNQTVLERIGVLANGDESILLRVFQDHASLDYWLFLLGKGDYHFDGALLSNAEGINYFIVQEGQKVHIPTDMAMNPIEETLFLTFPDDRASLGMGDLDANADTTIKFSGGQTMEVSFNYQSDNGSDNPYGAIIFTNANGPIQPTKLMLYHPLFTRMVPLFSDRAVIHLSQEKIEDTIQVFIYE